MMRDREVLARNRKNKRYVINIIIFLAEDFLNGRFKGFSIEIEILY